MPAQRLTPPAAPLIDLETAKAHLRVTSSDEDALIAGLVGAVTSHLDGVDGVLARALIRQSWDCFYGAFPPGRCPLTLPLSPLLSIEGVFYRDDTGAEQELDAAAFDVSSAATPPCLVPAPGSCWPFVQARPNAVRVEATFGYGDAAADVPAAIRQAALLLLGHFYQNREALGVSGASELPLGVQALIAPYMVRRF